MRAGSGRAGSGRVETDQRRVGSGPRQHCPGTDTSRPTSPTRPSPTRPFAGPPTHHRHSAVALFITERRRQGAQGRRRKSDLRWPLSCRRGGTGRVTATLTPGSVGHPVSDTRPPRSAGCPAPDPDRRPAAAGSCGRPCRRTAGKREGKEKRWPEIGGQKPVAGNRRPSLTTGGRTIHPSGSFVRPALQSGR